MWFLGKGVLGKVCVITGGERGWLVFFDDLIRASVGSNFKGNELTW